MTKATSRRALSLLEMALAFLIFGMAVVPILTLFFGTSKLQNKTTSHFREAVAGQLMWEAIKARVAINPRGIRDLAQDPTFEAKTLPHPFAPAVTVNALVHTAAFVERDGPLDASGRPLPVSSFATFLFNRTGAELYAPENRVSLDTGGPTSAVSAAEIASLAKNYQDLAVRVTIMDSALPATASPDPTTGRPAPSELVKDVFIDVYRVESDRKLPDVPAFHLESALETPDDSLTAPALHDLRVSTDDYLFENELAAAVAGVKGTIDASLLGDGMLRVGGDLVLVSIESVGEAVLSEGHDLGFNVSNGDTGQGSEYWVSQLLPLDSAVAKLSAADILAEQAKGIFRAYRRSESPIKELVLYSAFYAPRVREVVSSLVHYMRVAQSPLSTPAEKSAAKERARAVATGCHKILAQLGFWSRLLFQDRWCHALERPLNYPQRYIEALDRAQALYKAAEDHPRATPMDRVRALDGYVEVTRAKKLFLAQATLTDDEAYIRNLAASLASRMLPFAEALTGDELFDYPTLVARNDIFAGTLARMKQIVGPGCDYGRTVELLQPRGLLIKYRQRAAEVFDYFNLPEYAGELSGEITDLVQKVSATKFPTPPAPGEITGDTDPVPRDGEAGFVP